MIAAPAPEGQAVSGALMPRAFLGLASGNLLVVLGAVLLGLISPAIPDTYHVALGVFSLLLTCLVQVLGFTYLTVTFKLMAQAVHLTHDALDPLLAAKFLKRRFTRCLGTVMVVAIMATASGAVSWREANPGLLHQATGLLFPFLLLALLGIEFTLIVRNAALVEHVMRQYSGRKGSFSGEPSKSE